MGAQHTPGPYSVHPYTGVQGPHTNRDGVTHQSITIGAGEKMLGEVAYRSESAGYDCITNPDEMQAVANLWIAAPDLLVSLGEMVELYAQLVNCGDCGNWDPELEAQVIRARAAIRKARGEA